MASFTYKAVQIDGKTRQGVISAQTEAEAFSRLRAENLSPVAIRPTQVKTASTGAIRRLMNGITGRGQALSDADLEELFTSMAVLLRAGADIRTALTVLGGDSEGLRDVSQAILGGASVDNAFAPVIPASAAHLRGLIMAGEARGDLAAGLDSAARVLGTRRKIRQQLFEALSYPSFVFVTAIAALCVILLVVVPAIAPLLTDTGHPLPVYFRVIVFLSDALQQGWTWLLCGFALTAIAGYFGWRYWGLRRWLEAWLLRGPLGGIARALVFGGFARTLGDALQSGAGVTDALRLCQRSVGNAAARKRLENISTQVRQGSRLSDALRQVEGFPKPVIRLCEVGEASSTLGAMLTKAGEREEIQALSKIDKLSKLLGPLLIMALGAMIGALMGGVLTALTDIGGVAGA
jgi:type II secretory pathway component PulF